MGDEQALHGARAFSQLLGSERASDAAGVVDRLCAVQGQDVGAARLAIRARSTGLTSTDADSAPLVRTWLMRGTLQYVAAADVRWLLGLLGPGNQAGGARRRKQLGLDDELCVRAVAALREILSGTALGRDELRGRLAEAGVAVPTETQAMPHLLAYAAAAGVLCLGPELSHGRPSYALLDEPAMPLDRDAALAELARRYLRGHGPAHPADLAAWSGLGVRDAQQAFALLDPPPSPSVSGERAVRLLGHFDPYLLGYADKAFVVPEPFVKRVRTGGGFVTPSVVVDGRAVATWRLTAGRVTVEPFEPLEDDVLAGIEAEVADIARFLGSPAVLSRL